MLEEYSVNEITNLLVRNFCCQVQEQIFKKLCFNRGMAGKHFRGVFVLIQVAYPVEVVLYLITELRYNAFNPD